MTKDRIKEILSISGGQFDYRTGKYEGMLGVSPNSIVVWADDVGFSNATNDNDDAEPRNVGEFATVDEMLAQFRVDGELFADVVLPDIKEVIPIYS